MRPALLVALLLAAPLALAQAEGPKATLDIEVQTDRSEAITLSFADLKRLTRYEGLCLPAGARETRVYDELGDVQYEAKDENGRRVVSFLARNPTVSVDMTRPAPSDAEHPLYAHDANFCVPAQSSVVVNVRVPERHTLFFVSGGGTIAGGRTGTLSADGPVHVFYAYEAPLDGRRPMSIVEAAPFRIFVATSHAPAAQEVAQLAAEPFRSSLAEAGLDFPFDAMRVIYSEETPFSWEAGHYSGHGYVQVKQDTLTGDASAGYPLSAVRVLVHEAFHAASFPYGKGSVEDAVAWWLEGTARRSERHVDARMPNATLHCERTTAEVKCWDFDDRIKRGDLENGYETGFTFDAAWEPSTPQSEETRRFYYAYSEYVVGAWITRHGEAEYQRVWDAVAAAFHRGAGCPCADGWLVGILDDPDLFRPWQDLRAGSPDDFNASVEPFVKDEAALQRALDAESKNPFAGLPAAPLALVAPCIAFAARAWRRKPS